MSKEEEIFFRKKKSGDGIPSKLNRLGNLVKIKKMIFLNNLVQF